MTRERAQQLIVEYYNGNFNNVNEAITYFVLDKGHTIEELNLLTNIMQVLPIVDDLYKNAINYLLNKFNLGIVQSKPDMLGNRTVVMVFKI